MSDSLFDSFNATQIHQTVDIDHFSEKETIFIWIDILGFKNKLKEGCKNYDELADMLSFFQEIFKEKEGLYKTTVISDGIVLELNPQREQWKFENVKECFGIIKQKQLEFILEKKCVVRGAISVGTSRYNKENDRNYISNGLSSAYELESKSIYWPVIGTTQQYLDKMTQLYNESLESSPFKDVFERTLEPKGEDVYFLDIYSDLEGSKREVIEEIINFQLEENKNTRSVYNKYVWLYKCMHKYKGSVEKLNPELEKVVL
jgi:hypothetical protein